MIYFNKVTKIYPDSTVALDTITLSIAPKEFVSIVGHSGAGKTTLVKVMLKEEKPTSGEVFFESVNLDMLRGKQIPMYRRRIGAVFQDFKLLPGKTTYENVAFAMEAAGQPDSVIQSDVPEVLNLVGLEKRMWNFPYQLSGGGKQRVAIARAIINQPEIIIADEPTGNLDPTNSMEIIEILKKINDLGTTVILTTHNTGIVDRLGRRVITMDSGKIVRDDKEGKYVL